MWKERCTSDMVVVMLAGLVYKSRKQRANTSCLIRYFQFCITVALWFLSVPVESKVLTLQPLEQDRGNHETMRGLSNAVDGQALLLNKREPLSLQFCLRKRTLVQITNFTYSNGNNSEVVSLKMDDSPVSTFTTQEKGDWNDFLSFSQFPTSSYFDIGWHSVTVELSGVSDGIVVDKLDMDVQDRYVTSDIFTCKLLCIPDADFNFRPNPVVPEASFMTQNSFPTKCPEVDNVNIPIFNPNVKSFEILAKLPQYRSFSNWRSESTAGCDHLSPFLWGFWHLSLNDVPFGPVRGKQAILFASKGTAQSKLSVLIEIQFHLEGKSTGMIDAEIGSILKLKFSGSQARVQVTLNYKGRAGDVAHGDKKILLTPQSVHAQWNISDFTWSEDGYNRISLHVDSNTTQTLEIEEVFLERRPMLPETIRTVYKSDNVIVETISDDFWWLAPDNMTLFLSNGHHHENVSYFRLYRPIPWSDSYAQVFVLYQDGNCRLLPFPPHGVDWIPFGSSVIIGQSKPLVVRPSASIASVHLDLDNIRLRLIYTNGDSANLELVTSLTETRLIISDIMFRRTPSLLPFATFRSMYVSEGYTDVDHVNIDGSHTFHIMHNFGFAFGRHFVFFRKCMSKHLNLSPDIYIDVRETSNRACKGSVTACKLMFLFMFIKLVNTLDIADNLNETTLTKLLR